MSAKIKAYLNIDDLDTVKSLIHQETIDELYNLKIQAYRAEYGVINPGAPSIDEWECESCDDAVIDEETRLWHYITKYNYSPKDVREANNYLNNTDWYVTRFIETSEPIPSNISDKRSKSRSIISNWNETIKEHSNVEK